MTTFAEHYHKLISDIMAEENVAYEVNRRTGVGISFLPWGHSFEIDLRDNMLPTCGLRRTRPHIAAAEAAWCFMGTTDLTWLGRHTSVWNQFADEDGNVTAAYGYRWRFAFEFDQIAEAVGRLQADPTDRRIWISSYDPPEDLFCRDQKTVPCPVGFTLSMYENRLNSSLMIRSSDVVTGLPYDMMRHALVMRAVASTISEATDLGHMRVTLAHPHIYETQWNIAYDMLEQKIQTPPICMPQTWDISRIILEPDIYVEKFNEEVLREIFASESWPEYDPKINVVK